MTNEEKANAIAEYDDENYIHRYAGAMQMAKWKDEQFAAFINRIVDTFDFQEFLYVDSDGSLDFHYDKFYMFLKEISKEN